MTRSAAQTLADWLELQRRSGDGQALACALGELAEALSQGANCNRSPASASWPQLAWDPQGGWRWLDDGEQGGPWTFSLGDFTRFGDPPAAPRSSADWTFPALYLLTLVAAAPLELAPASALPLERNDLHSPATSPRVRTILSQSDPALADLLRVVLHLYEFDPDDLPTLDEFSHLLDRFRRPPGMKTAKGVEAATDSPAPADELPSPVSPAPVTAPVTATAPPASGAEESAPDRPPSKAPELNETSPAPVAAPVRSGSWRTRRAQPSPASQEDHRPASAAAAAELLAPRDEAPSRETTLTEDPLLAAILCGDDQAAARLFDLRAVRQRAYTPGELETIARWVQAHLRDRERIGLAPLQLACEELVIVNSRSIQVRWKWPDPRFADQCLLAVCRRPPLAGELPHECELAYRKHERDYRGAVLVWRPEWAGLSVAVWAVIDLGASDSIDSPPAHGQPPAGVVYSQPLLLDSLLPQTLEEPPPPPTGLGRWIKGMLAGLQRGPSQDSPGHDD